MGMLRTTSCTIVEIPICMHVQVITNLSFTARNISQRGLMCEVLNLRSSRFRKLNMIGEFKRIHTLNLDYSTSLTSFKEDCFSCMPNLICLSMCETRVGNLWTTIAALSKLPSLAELRFQNWLCCDDTGNSSGSSDQDDKTDFSQLNICSSFGAYGNVVINPDSQILVEDSSDDSEVDFSIQHREYDYLELLSNLVPQLDGEIDLWNEVNCLVFFSVSILRGLALSFSLEILFTLMQWEWKLSIRNFERYCNKHIGRRLVGH